MGVARDDPRKCKCNFVKDESEWDFRVGDEEDPREWDSRGSSVTEMDNRQLRRWIIDSYGDG